ncbi:MAG: hypothetical protein J3K34DRAFT_474249 [Monoraphidium minutum]|nr:MAG: hypothetical protein J3K34DRAFT_474249 [Monoraphidium minutum]
MKKNRSAVYGVYIPQALLPAWFPGAAPPFDVEVQPFLDGAPWGPRLSSNVTAHRHVSKGLARALAPLAGTRVVGLRRGAGPRSLELLLSSERDSAPPPPPTPEAAGVAPVGALWAMNLLSSWFPGAPLPLDVGLRVFLDGAPHTERFASRISACRALAKGLSQRAELAGARLTAFRFAGPAALDLLPGALAEAAAEAYAEVVRVARALGLPRAQLRAVRDAAEEAALAGDAAAQHAFLGIHYSRLQGACAEGDAEDVLEWMQRMAASGGGGGM